MEVNDAQYYPRPFGSFAVTARDANGKPTTTEFYKNEDYTGLIYTWTQEWTADGELNKFSKHIEEE